MVAKLEEIQECKKASFETNERINKIWVKRSIKRRKYGQIEAGCKRDENICTTNSWTDVCGIEIIYYVCDELEKNVENSAIPQEEHWGIL